MSGIAGMGTPREVGSPVPGADEAQALANPQPVQAPMNSPTPTPLAAPDQAPAGPDLDALFAQHGGQAPDSSGPNLDALFAQHGGGSDQATSDQIKEANQGDGESALSKFGNFAFKTASELSNPIGTALKAAADPEVRTRVAASFASTPTEKEGYLQQVYGDGNVKKAGKDDFLVKKDGKWKKFNSDAFDLVNFAADHASDVVQQGATQLGTAGGLLAATGEAAAAPETAGASLFAIPGTVAAARAAGGVAGQAAKDTIAAGIGIPRDPNRSALTEYGLAATANAAFGRLGDWVGSKVAAQAAAAPAEKLMSHEQIFQNEIGTINDANQVLKDTGVFNEPATLLEQNPSNPEAQTLFQKVAKLPQVQQVLELKNQAFDKGIQSWLNMVSNFTGEKNDVGQRAGDYIRQQIKSEGALIGDYRQEFMKQAGDGELPVKDLAGKVSQIADKLGFSMSQDGTQLVRPSIEDLQAQGYSPEGADNLMRLVEGLNEKIYNGEDRLNAKELMGLYNQYSNLTDNLYKRGGSVDGAYRWQVTQMKNAIRDELTNKMGVVLDGNEAYKQSLSKFSAIKDGADQISQMLDKDQISSMAFAKNLFSKGANGLDNIRATKTVLQDRPDIWNDLVGQHVADTANEFRNPGTGRVDWNRFTKKISGLGDEVLGEMFGSNNKKVLNAFSTVGKNLENVSNISGITPVSAASINKDLAVGLWGGIYNAAGNAYLKIIGGLDTERALFTTLQKDGIDNFLKSAPTPYKPWLKTVYQGYLDSQNAVLSSPATQAGLRQGTQSLYNSYKQRPQQ